MFKFKKGTILIIILILLLDLIGVFFYKRWQMKEKLIKQHKQIENLMDELKDVKKISFIECKKLKVQKDAPPIPIFLLGAWDGDWESHIWNLIVIDPEGYGTGGYEFPLYPPGMESQMPHDMDGDGTMDDIIMAGSRKIGDYLVIVALGSEVSTSDTYSLQLGDFVLAKDVPFSERLSDRLYILRQTETGIIPIVPASVGCPGEKD